MSIAPIITPRAQRAQTTFRALLRANAQPGLPVRLPAADPADPVATLAAALVDHETTFATVGPDATQFAARIRRQTGAREVDLSQAQFAFLIGDDGGRALSRLAQGTLIAPYTGATAFYVLDADRCSVAPTVRLTGPGIAAPRDVPLTGLGVATAEAIQATRAAYPCGVDVVLADMTGSLIALPRSTRVEVL